VQPLAPNFAVSDMVFVTPLAEMFTDTTVEKESDASPPLPAPMVSLDHLLCVFIFPLPHPCTLSGR
jgi:hypothetical protein